MIWTFSVLERGSVQSVVKRAQNFAREINEDETSFNIGDDVRLLLWNKFLHFYVSMIIKISYTRERETEIEKEKRKNQ